MARYNFKCRCTKESIDNLIKELNHYKEVTLPNKTKQFVEELAEYGIHIARENLGIIDDLGNVGYLVKVYKEVESSNGQVKAIIYACDEMSLTKSWLSKTPDGREIVKTAEISPLLMYEFGSGANSINVWGANGVGRGTFPSENNKPFGNRNHAYQDAWHWKDLDGTWHSTNGITPTMPMYSAVLEMQKQYTMIARKVFG